MSLSPGRTGRVNVIQGDYYVCDSPETVLTTVLGSCVSACMRDPVSGVGGMNHFLLPGRTTNSGDGVESESYAVHLMELLVNGLLSRGAQRHRLQAKLFGGGKMIADLPDVGMRNAAFAQNFLTKEGIEYLGGSVGGELARRVDFWPSTGRARQKFVQAEQVPAKAQPVARPVREDSGDVELF